MVNAIFPAAASAVVYCHVQWQWQGQQPLLLPFVAGGWCNNQPDRGSQGKLCFVNLHFCSTWRTHHWYGRIAGLCGNWCTDSNSRLLSCFCQCDWLLHVGMEDIIVMVHLPWWTMVMKAFFGDRNPSVFFGFLENTSLAVRRRFPIPSDGIQVYFSAFWKTPV